MLEWTDHACADRDRDQERGEGNRVRAGRAIMSQKGYGETAS